MTIDLNNAGSLASIASLAFTGWAVWEVRSLHHFYKRHLMLPRFSRRVELHLAGLNVALQEKRTDDVKTLLRKCDALIERMPRYADKTLRERVEIARASISEVLLRQDGYLLENTPTVLSDISATIESAKAYTKEDIWKT